MRHASRSTQRPLDQAPLGVLPADQGLEGDALATVQADYGLVEKDELVFVDGLLELGGAFETVAHRLLQRRLVDLVTVLTLGLGRVHGHVGRLQELGRALEAALAIGDPHTGVDRDKAVVDRERRFQIGQDPLGRQAGVGDVLGRLQQDGKLVATEAGGRVTRAQRAHQASGHRDQQLVDAGLRWICPLRGRDQVDLAPVQPLRNKAGLQAALRESLDRQRCGAVKRSVLGRRGGPPLDQRQSARLNAEGLRAAVHQQVKLAGPRGPSPELLVDVLRMRTGHDGQIQAEPAGFDDQRSQVRGIGRTVRDRGAVPVEDHGLVTRVIDGSARLGHPPPAAAPTPGRSPRGSQHFMPTSSRAGRRVVQAA